jgi:DNA invertase Pin-like site-specific DNA recombinase
VPPKAYSYIRFSSAEQQKGDSLRRQVELSEDYARKHNLELDKELTFYDLGVSAFNGKNRDEGALRQFIEAVETGKVAPHSWLLVESLDRISRDNITSALTLFLQLLDLGLTVVTLGDDRKYAKATVNANPMELMASLMVFSRANEESATKSKRVSAAWSAKQKEAAQSGKPTTSRCPLWLRLTDDRSRYELIPERAAIVRRIFDMAAGGSMGQAVIAQHLNVDGVPPFGKSKRWASSSVRKILVNRSTIGEYQPTTLNTDGERVAASDPVLGFYPAAVDQELFEATQEARSGRRISGRGRKGKNFSSLFTGLAKCSCGASLHYVNKANPKGRAAAKAKGRPVSHHTYLICSAAKSGDNSACEYTAMRYDLLEPAILSTLLELDFQQVIESSQPDQAAEIERLKAVLAASEKRLTEAQRGIDNLVDSIFEGSAPEAITQRITERESQLPELKADVERRRALLISSRLHTDQVSQTVLDFRSAYASMSSEKDTERLYQLRSKLHHHLQSLISELMVREWPYDPVREEHLPVEYPGFFSPRGNGKVLSVFYRLKDDTAHLKARCVLVNTITREVVSLTERVGEEERPILDGRIDQLPESVLTPLLEREGQKLIDAGHPELVEALKSASPAKLSGMFTPEEWAEFDSVLQGSYSHSFYQTLGPSGHFEDIRHSTV